jgi:TPP-dependent trihydroxycyclohexane-1,2-dione (THcHDO) dehydratase
VGVGIDGDAVAAQVLGAVHGAVDALVEVVEVVVCDAGAVPWDLPPRWEARSSSMRWALELDSLTMVGVRSGSPAFFPFDLAAMK